MLSNQGDQSPFCRDNLDAQAAMRELQGALSENNSQQTKDNISLLRSQLKYFGEARSTFYNDKAQTNSGHRSLSRVASITKLIS